MIRIAVSTYLADQLLNWLKDVDVVASPTTSYVALFTDDPTDAGSGTEVSGGAYARVAVTGATGWSAISSSGGGRLVSNAANITFPTATADWGLVTYAAVFSASTAGNMFFYGPVTRGGEAGVTILDTETFYFPAGEFSVQVGDAN